MLIKCAGFMWHRRHVDWGRRQLLGVSEDGGRKEVDFADQSGIYGLYDGTGQCVYIGHAGKGEQVCLYDRLRDHALEDHLFCFWERFTWFGFYSPEQLLEGQFEDPIATAVSLEEALNAFESVAIYLGLPRFNRRYGSGFGGVAWYYQLAEYEEAKNARR
ncbi:MAG: hypothetical protein JRI96_18820 [Deltaproteobacteria bacterium]|nr:hypothetical protein [Deltaproteobacteria bacterium]